MVLGIDLVVGTVLVDGNVIKGTAVLKMSCCPGSADTCNECWLFNFCSFVAVVENLPKSFPKKPSVL